MSVTPEQLEAARNAAVDCVRSASSAQLDLFFRGLPHGDMGSASLTSIADLDEFVFRTFAEMRERRDRLHERLDEVSTVLERANVDRPEGLRIPVGSTLRPTYHQVALDVADGFIGIRDTMFCHMIGFKRDSRGRVTWNGREMYEGDEVLAEGRQYYQVFYARHKSWRPPIEVQKHATLIAEECARALNMVAADYAAMWAGANTAEQACSGHADAKIETLLPATDELPATEPRSFDGTEAWGELDEKQRLLFQIHQEFEEKLGRPPTYQQLADAFKQRDLKPQSREGMRKAVRAIEQKTGLRLRPKDDPADHSVAAPE